MSIMSRNQKLLVIAGSIVAVLAVVGVALSVILPFLKQLRTADPGTAGPESYVVEQVPGITPVNSELSSPTMSAPIEGRVLSLAHDGLHGLFLVTSSHSEQPTEVRWVDVTAPGQHTVVADSKQYPNLTCDVFSGLSENGMTEDPSHAVCFTMGADGRVTILAFNRDDPAKVTSIPLDVQNKEGFNTIDVLGVDSQGTTVMKLANLPLAGGDRTVLLAADTKTGTLSWTTAVEPYSATECFVRQTTLVCSETPDDQQNGQNRIIFIDTTNGTTKNTITSASADQLLWIDVIACDGIVIRADGAINSTDSKDSSYEGGPFLYNLNGEKTSDQEINTRVSVTGGCVRSDALSSAITNDTLAPNGDFIMTLEGGETVMKPSGTKRESGSVPQCASDTSGDVLVCEKNFGASFDMMSRDSGQYLDAIGSSLAERGNSYSISQVMISAGRLAVIYSSASSTDLVTTVAVPA